MATQTLINVQIESHETAATVAARLAEVAGNKHVGITKLARFLLAIAQGAKRGKVSMAIDTAANVTKATGDITLTGIPVADETVTIGGVVLTWKATAANEDQVTIGTGKEDTGDNLAAAINAHSAFKGVITATSDGAGVVTVTAALPGKAGNLITLAEASSNLTVGGATLSGADSTEQEALVSWAVGTV